MDEDDNELGIDLNYFDSGIQIEDSKSNKKIIIITIAIIFALLIIAAIIFIIFLPKKNNKVSYEIICKYKIQDISKETRILSENFQLNSNLSIYINDKKIENNKNHNFLSAGQHTINYKINSNEINLDYIFKDIISLISEEMKSLKNIKILSLMSAFENCINLNSFSISGFNFTNISSTKKLFYTTNLTNIDISIFNNDNIEDMSYMFSNCASLTSFDLSKLKTSKLKTMSNMFYN